MSLTTCARHPDQPAKGLCGRCGDFLCAACKAESPAGVCPACATRVVEAPPPAPSGLATIGLVVAILCALLSGGFLLSLSGLSLALSKATNPMTVWNGAIGFIYFVIAFGLLTRKPWGYTWSLGTQRLNSFLQAYYFFSNFTSGKASMLVIVLSGLDLAFNLVGWGATWLARPHFQGTRRAARRDPRGPASA